MRELYPIELCNAKEIAAGVFPDRWPAPVQVAERCASYG